jgi:hypothetical protein
VRYALAFLILTAASARGADPLPKLVKPCPAGHLYCDCGCTTGGACACAAAKANGPGTCDDPAYKEAWKTAIRAGRPLFVYVGQPVADINWLMWYMSPITVSVKEFPDAKAPCVVLGQPTPSYPTPATSLERVADLPGNPAAGTVQAAYYHLRSAPTVTYYQTVPAFFGGFGGGCASGRCGR